VATRLTSTAGWQLQGHAAACRAAWVRWWPVIAILVFALAYRAPTFGNPILDFDEQLYLTVGDRMLQGHLPYVEMWDRKPPGLFAIYAAIRLLGGEGVVQYQLAATFCAGATAALIYGMARRGAGVGGSLIVALAYLLFLNPLHGAGGQSPVFYNLLTACEAWLALKASDSTRQRTVIGCALAAMALAGLAIQCKYTPVVEGIYFGLVFLGQFRRVGMHIRVILGAASAMVALALLPTLVAIGIYWHLGHLDAFVQANFLSIFARNPFPPERSFQQRMLVGVIGGPVILMAIAKIVRARRAPRSEGGADFRIVGGWCVAAMISFAMLGDFFDFYFIAVMPPLLVFVASLADLPGRMRALTAGFLLVWPFFLAPPQLGLAARDREAASLLVKAIEPYVANGRCLYVYDGPAILYLLTGACVPTRFIYPDHLNNPTEIPALGVDAVAEMKRLLATRPGAIVFADRSVVPQVDPATRGVLLDVLKRDYVRVARVRADRSFDVFALRSLHPGPGLLPGIPIDPR
jgi:hypothetical protein